MNKKKDLEGKAARVRAKLDKVDAEIATMTDDEAELKKNDWVLVKQDDKTFLRVVLREEIDGDGDIAVDGGRMGWTNYAKPSECTRIPFDVLKLVESMMALLPCKDH